jgi:hypothetical protein
MAQNILCVDYNLNIIFDKFSKSLARASASAWVDD